MATPPGDYPKEKVVLFLTDVFGVPLTNNKVRRLPKFPNPHPVPHNRFFASSPIKLLSYHTAPR